MSRKDLEKGVLWGVITPATPVISRLSTFSSPISLRRSPDPEPRPISGKNSRPARSKGQSAPTIYDQQTCAHQWQSTRGKVFVLKAKSIKYPQCVEASGQYAKEYFMKTQIPGLRYIVDDRSWCERSFWSCIISVMFSGCLYAMYLLYQISIEEPIIGFKATNIHLHEVPFPAVTICPPSVVQSKTFHYNEIYSKLRTNQEITPEEFRKFSTVDILCHGMETGHYGAKVDILEEFVKDNDVFFNDIVELAPKVNDVFYQCDYQNFQHLHSCSSLMSPIILDQGLCYSFNMGHWKNVLNEHTGTLHLWQKLNVSLPEKFDWDVNLGIYPDHKVENIYPIRSYMSGEDNGLTLVMMHRKDQQDTECKEGRLGFRIMLHNHVEIPRIAEFGVNVPLASLHTIVVTPRLTSSTNRVNHIDPMRRNCYLDTDRSLDFFKHYTFSNCKRECYSKHMFKACGCVTFHLPHSQGSKICGRKSYSCIREHLILLHTDSKATFVSSNQKNFFTKTCNCLPLCTELHYDISTSSTSWDWEAYNEATLRRNASPNIPVPKDIIMTKLKVYFGEDQFMGFERSELHSRVDLISQVGGLLTLFTGMSVMSFLEIIYYCTLRLYFSRKTFGIATVESPSDDV